MENLLEDLKLAEEFYGSNGRFKKNIIFYPSLRFLSLLIMVLQYIATVGVGIYFVFWLHSYLLGILMIVMGFLNGFITTLIWVVVGLFVRNYGLSLFELTIFVLSLINLYGIPFYLLKKTEPMDKNKKSKDL